jgi:hypothetical protein
LLAITVLAMDPEARPHDQYEKLRPHTADRTLAVEITIANLLPHNGYYGTPVHDLAVVGSDGRTYPADLSEDITESPMIAESVVLNPGKARTGWIAVPIPRSVQPRSLRFQDEFGGPVAEWLLAGVPTASSTSAG